MSRYRISSAISRLRRNDLEVVSHKRMQIWFEERATAYNSLSTALWQERDWPPFSILAEIR